MKDRSLGREERSRAIQEIKIKYGDPSAENQGNEVVRDTRIHDSVGINMKKDMELQSLRSSQEPECIRCMTGVAI
jgi:hypothetical protein